MKFNKFSLLYYLTVLILVLSSLSACSKPINQPDKIFEFTDDEIKTLESVKQVDDYPLYVMYYEGGYGFEEYIQRGISVSDTDSEYNNDQQCTCIAMYSDDDDAYFGRNLDWNKCPILVMYSNPPNGYASISIVDLEYLGFNSKDNIAEMSLDDRVSLLSSPYFPFDGMNEYGVCIGNMTLSGSIPPFDPNKVTLGSLTTIRNILNYARNTEEAIQLFNEYNVVFDGPSPDLHYLVCDPSGDSAIIEFINGEMKVIQTKQDNIYQICTNSQIYGTTDNEIRSHCGRYNRAFGRLKELDGKVDMYEAMNIMELVSTNSTQWSSVYNMKTGDVNIAVGRNFDNVYTFNFDMIEQSKP